MTINANMKPPINPTRIKGEASGIEKAVNTAVAAVMRSSMPVFSDTPSIVIILDS